MMQVRRMGMTVSHGLMLMPMTVQSRRYRGMRVRMMAIIMRMGMLMLDRFVCVLMRVLFGHVQNHTSDHQNPTAHQPQTPDPFA